MGPCRPNDGRDPPVSVSFAITNGESVFGERLIPEKSFGLLNQLLACGSAVRCDFPGFDVEIVFAFKLSDVITGMHVFDHVIGFFAPLHGLIGEFSLIEGLFQQNGQRVNQLQRALHAFDVIEILRH